VAPSPASDAGATPQTAVRGRPFINSLGMKFVPVPCGSRTVLFSVWETRVSDFKSFIDDSGTAIANPIYVLTPAGWKNPAGATWDKPSHSRTPNHPICGISFDQAVLFCRWLSKKENRQYRLPSDYEWSCAAELGDREDPASSPQSKSNRIDGTFPWGTGWPPPATAGNYAGEESKSDAPADWRTIEGGWADRFPRTAPVGSFPENRLGLFDIGGNVFEWCDTPFSGPRDSDRTLRGACWATCEKLYLNSTYRVRGPRHLCVEQYGFRIVLDPKEK
jgi:formylglycine-generating enzyme required for sulfatase activity